MSAGDDYGIIDGPDNVPIMRDKQIMALINHATATLQDYPIIAGQLAAAADAVSEREEHGDTDFVTPENMQTLAYLTSALFAALMETRSLVDQMLNPQTKNSQN